MPAWYIRYDLISGNFQDLIWDRPLLPLSPSNCIQHDIVCTHWWHVCSHWQFGSGHLLREYSSREAKLSEMKVSRQDRLSMNPLIHSPPGLLSRPPSVRASMCVQIHPALLTDANKLSSLLPLRDFVVEKLSLPAQHQTLETTDTKK